MAKVLVIDDEMGNLNMFRLFLKAYGHTVLLAENGPDGLDLIEQEKPAIVFTDIKMPGMDGFEVLKQVKQVYPQTEVIVMTGHGDMDLAVQALNLDATDFITKPIQREALDAALTRAEERIRAATTPQENRVTVRDEKNGLFILHIQGNVTAYSEDILLGSYRGIPPTTSKSYCCISRKPPPSMARGSPC